MTRTAVIAGALVSAAGLATPGASAGTTANTPTAQTKSVKSIETAAKWTYCKGTKPEVCGKQWTKNFAGKKTRVFQAFAVNKMPGKITGYMGVQVKKSGSKRGYYVWTNIQRTLEPARATVSGAEKCPSGRSVRGVWNPGGFGGKPETFKTSKWTICKKA